MAARVEFATERAMYDNPAIIKELEDRGSAFMARIAAMPARAMIASYENRFVALLDILGFREALANFAVHSPNELFHAIVDSHWFHAATTEGACDFQLFSDSIIVNSKDDQASSFISVANLVNNLRNSFLERGIVLRGAIAFGRHFNKHGICISPALVEAHDLEKMKAVSARILVSETAAERVLQAVTRNAKGRCGIAGPRWFHVARDQLPVRDTDDLMVVEFLPDTLEAYFLRTGHHHDPDYTPTAEQIEHLQNVGPQLLMRWKGGLEQAQARCRKPEHQQKVDYLVAKWNKYIESFKCLSDSEKSSFLILPKPSELTSP